MRFVMFPSYLAGFCIILLHQSVLCLDTTTPGLYATSPHLSLKVSNQQELTVKDWISKMTQKNYATEITHKIGNILRPDMNNDQLNIAINMDMKFPDYSKTTLNNNSIVFSGLSINYENVDHYSLANIVEIKCAESIQINVTKSVRRLNIQGYINITNAESESRNELKISLENVLISNIRSSNMNETYIFYALPTSSSKTTLYYTNMQPDIAASEKNAVEILSSLPLLLPHIQSNIHEHVHESVSVIIATNFAVLNEAQCGKSNANANSPILNKMYIIEEQQFEKTETHTITVGPAIISGFSNITEVIWQYARTAGGTLHIKTSLNIGVLYIKSDWEISSSIGNVFSTTNAYKINNARFSYNYEYTNYYRLSETFKANMEVVKSEQPQSVLDDIVCVDLNKLIKNSFS